MFQAILIAIKAFLILNVLAGFNALIRNPNMKGLIYGGGHVVLGISGIYAIDARFRGGMTEEKQVNKEEKD